MALNCAFMAQRCIQQDNRIEDIAGQHYTGHIRITQGVPKKIISLVSLTEEGTFFGTPCSIQHIAG